LDSAIRDADQSLGFHVGQSITESRIITSQNGLTPPNRSSAPIDPARLRAKVASLH
jgi:hypothetical protein